MIIIIHNKNEKYKETEKEIKKYILKQEKKEDKNIMVKWPQ